ncbi:MAG: A/G-specific adenine glycosylase [Cyclobacteriaceae bacterium]|nr:A/G-specific adenine glycosylase [Cyclobacteriaceae bacterium]
MDKRLFSKNIIGWYELNKRSLPWRTTQDPYKIWLSEIILQQTRIAQGLPYYKTFEKNFPDVESLAAAKPDKVLRLWQGLGYYSRARNLHACAKQLVKTLNGKFPSSFEELKKLPGIGDYTAAAIASISFREPVAVVDGNVFRVLARVFGIDLDIASSEGKKYFLKKANELIPTDMPDIFNQAVMEFGALHCTPQNPKCESCPFERSCVANVMDLQKLLPVKTPKQKIRKRYFNYVVVNHRGKLLMRKRVAGDIWSGLYDFYLIETKKSIKPYALLKQEKKLDKLVIEEISVLYKHILSHQHLITRFIKCSVKSPEVLKPLMNENTLKFYSIAQVEKLPKPILVNRFLKESGYLD